MSSVFNVDSVKEKIKQFNVVTDIESIRSLFKEELMDWIDCYHETLVQRDHSDATADKGLSTNLSDEAIQAQSSIVQLWIEYGTFEKNLHQFKKAVQVISLYMVQSSISTTNHDRIEL